MKDWSLLCIEVRVELRREDGAFSILELLLNTHFNAYINEIYTTLTFITLEW